MVEEHQMCYETAAVCKLYQCLLAVTPAATALQISSLEQISDFENVHTPSSKEHRRTLDANSLISFNCHR